VFVIFISIMLITNLGTPSGWILLEVVILSNSIPALSAALRWCACETVACGQQPGFIDQVRLTGERIMPIKFGLRITVVEISEVG